MDNYEDDKARYWRNCDLWTFNEVQFLLNGQWPEDKPPPSSLNLILLETEFDVDHPLEDGSVMTTTETEAKVINPLPFRRPPEFE
ncbi:MAG: hypothetical protein K2Q11_03035 [Burkholderiaceae bacterium]|nr:hypothetical protein [Burkholderiaceae bacterium]